MRVQGFTLIELLAVLAILATLLTLAAPRYFGAIERSKEAVLKENLFQMRDAISKYRADKGHYPESLETLAAEQYLRNVPIDPVTGSTQTWVLVAASGEEAVGISDVRSGAPGAATDGTNFAVW